MDNIHCRVKGSKVLNGMGLAEKDISVLRMQATGREFLVLVRPFLVSFADANERGLDR
jgi:hypothetical protein